MEAQTTLINFNIPDHLKTHLDRLVKFKGVSRTSVLNRLIEDWIRTEESLLVKDNKINDLISMLECRPTTKKSTGMNGTYRSTNNNQPRWEDSY